MPVYHIGELPSSQLPDPVRRMWGMHIYVSTKRLLTHESTVLFRLKQGVTPAQLSVWTQKAKDMVGKIPG